MNLLNLNLVYLFISSISCNTVTDRVDFENDCSTQIVVNDYKVVEVFAEPQAGVLPDTSACQAKFLASPADRKLRIYVQKFFLGPGACGHKLKIYDGDPYQNEPKWELGCNTPLDTYTSATNEIIISFVKPTVDTSQLYSFNIKITTDKDQPYLLFEALKIPDYRIMQHRQRRESGNIPSYTAPNTAGSPSSGGITSGAIAGIAVGCVVGAVIIIAICIYALWRFMRQAEEKKRYGDTAPPPVFVTSAPPLSNCGIAPGSSRRSFRTQSHVAFSDISKKSEKDSSASDGISKSRSSKSYENHGFSHDGTSVSSSNTKSENLKDGNITSGKNIKSTQRDNFKDDKINRGSYRKDKKENNINYPDVVDSARKIENKRHPRNDNEQSMQTDARSRSDSVKRTDREREKHVARAESIKKNERDREKQRDRSESLGRDRHASNRHKSREDDFDRDRTDKRYDKFQNDRRLHRPHKTESVFTDESGTTNLSSVSDRYHDRLDGRNKQTDRHGNRRHRAELFDDRRYRDDRYDDRGYQGDRHDDRRYRDRRQSERSTSERRERIDSHRDHRDFEDRDNELRRSRRGESKRQRSHSSSRVQSRDKYSDNDRNYHRDRGRYDDDRDPGLRRRESSRSQNGRHRSRSSYR